eukprot:5559698-Amphidinium_carterae.3
MKAHHEAATAPKGEKILAPACGQEEATELKPDHVAVRLPLQLEGLSSGFRGQAVYEEPQFTEPREVEPRYQAAQVQAAARANHAGAWIPAKQELNTAELWRLWCTFSEEAIGLPAGSRGRLLLAQRKKTAPAPEDEALAAAKQQAEASD